MCQRNTSKLDQRVHEILTDSMQNEGVRNEVYISLIKQMTNNPLPASVDQVPQL